MGADALKIYDGLQFQGEHTLKQIIDKFDEYTIGEVNETYERYVFNGHNQSPDKSFDNYLSKLRSLMKTCGFCDCLKDSLLRDKIVLGINNNNTRKRLLQERNLDLKKCIDLCRSSEAASTHLKSISNATNHEVHRVKEHKRSNATSSQKNDRNVPHQRQTRNSCKFCGRNHPLKRELCPALQKALPKVQIISLQYADKAIQYTG